MREKLVRLPSFREVFRPSGRISGPQYLITGLFLFSIKYFIDLVLAWALFDEPWSIRNYWAGEQARLVVRLFDGAISRSSQWFYATMLAAALPFIWLGITLTVQRLRTLHAPIWLAVLFFVPVINLLMFLLLAIRRTPTEPPEESRADQKARSPLWRAGWIIICTGALGALLSLFNIHALRTYGVGLFVALPFGLGTIASVLFGLRSALSVCGGIAVAILSVSLSAILLFSLGYEGGACIVMAAPIWLGCAALGGIVGALLCGYTRDQREAIIIALALALSLPALMGMERVVSPRPTLLMVQSTVEVAAEPHLVWQRVVSFPEIPEPTERVFKVGIAYPTGADISGRRVGAIRRCRFSTGDFLEPIEVWEEPKRLAFAVVENPPPMQEWSFYEHVNPPHLHGFLRSRAGEFFLTSLGPNRTMLTGRTWYENAMWPAFYWQLWSDYLIRTIHLRVLHHIRGLCEHETSARTPDDSKHPAE